MHYHDGKQENKAKQTTSDKANKQTNQPHGKHFADASHPAAHGGVLFACLLLTSA